MTTIPTTTDSTALDSLNDGRENASASAGADGGGGVSGGYTPHLRSGGGSSASAGASGAVGGSSGGSGGGSRDRHSDTAHAIAQNGDHPGDQSGAADSRKLIVLGLPWTSTEESIRQYFEQFGRVVDSYVVKDMETGKSRGFGFVTFENEDSAQSVLNHPDQHMIDGRRVDPKRPLAKAETPPAVTAPRSHAKKIFIAKLSLTTNEDTLRRYFEKFGEISDVYIPKDPIRRESRGIAFVMFEKEEAIDTVMQQKDHEIDGRLISVDRATPRGSLPHGRFRDSEFGDNDEGYSHGERGGSRSAAYFYTSGGGSGVGGGGGGSASRGGGPSRDYFYHPYSTAAVRAYTDDRYRSPAANPPIYDPRSAAAYPDFEFRQPTLQPYYSNPAVSRAQSYYASPMAPTGYENAYYLAPTNQIPPAAPNGDNAIAAGNAASLAMGLPLSGPNNTNPASMGVGTALTAAPSRGDPYRGDPRWSAEEYYGYGAAAAAAAASQAASFYGMPPAGGGQTGPASGSAPYMSNIRNQRAERAYRPYSIGGAPKR